MNTLGAISEVIRKKIENVYRFVKLMVYVYSKLAICALPGILVTALFFGLSPKALYYGGFYSIVVIAIILYIAKTVDKA